MPTSRRREKARERSRSRLVRLSDGAGRAPAPAPRALAEENRQTLNAEIAKAKAAAEAEAANAMAAADARIDATRVEAKGHVTKAAEEAAIAIVARLTGETVSPADAAAGGRRKPDHGNAARAGILGCRRLRPGDRHSGLEGRARMVGKMLDQRAAVIAAELTEARRLREEAAALLADYKAKAAGAEREAESIVTEARAEADPLRGRLPRRSQGPDRPPRPGGAGPDRPGRSRGDE